jgi:ATP-dependent Clp protease ATP-binding subunit ClpA
VFERFTEAARQAVALAQDEARVQRHTAIGTEHLLLGLLREEDGSAARALRSFALTVDNVRAALARIVDAGEEPVSGQIPFTPRAKKALQLALREALAIGDNFIGTEHVLLGLVRENGGIAAQILLEFDADDAKVREEVIRVLSEPLLAAGIRPAEPPVDGATAPAIDETLRARSVGDLLDLATTAKQAAMDRQDFKRAGIIRELEGQLVSAVNRIDHLVEHDRGS